MKIRTRAIAAVICGAVLVAGMDQFVKRLVVERFHLDESRAILPGLLDLTYRQNTGVAFSRLQHSPNLLVILLNLFVLAVFIAVIRNFLTSRLGVSAAILVMGGAIGNLVDRVLWHHVIDYVDLHVWPVFNLADSCVVVGVLLLIVLIARPATPPRVPGGESV